EAFLPAANNYLLEQNWPEGFATAIHIAVRLDTGQFWVSTAGHPPAVHIHAGSGRVQRLDTTGGPALGVVVAPLFAVHTGTFQHGDTVMLYTDGLVEAPGADVELGIDRLMGAAERFISTRSGGADAVLAGVRAGEADDRGLILIHRD
ncbi:MAG: PP2C family protein-serine/threonine phosphatase, partial [Actinomycetes bacterium]